MQVLDVGEVECLQSLHCLAAAVAACTVNEHGLLAIQGGHLWLERGITDGDMRCVWKCSGLELGIGSHVQHLCLGMLL